MARKNTAAQTVAAPAPVAPQGPKTVTMTQIAVTVLTAAEAQTREWAG